MISSSRSRRRGLAVAMYSVFCLLASAYVLQPGRRDVFRLLPAGLRLRAAATISAEVEPFTLCRAHCCRAAPGFEVCQNKYCKKKGAAKTLALFEELAEGRDDVLVEKADMSHTEHGCFDECTMGRMSHWWRRAKDGQSAIRCRPRREWRQGRGGDQGAVGQGGGVVAVLV